MLIAGSPAVCIGEQAQVALSVDGKVVYKRFHNFQDFKREVKFFSLAKEAGISFIPLFLGKHTESKTIAMSKVPGYSVADSRLTIEERTRLAFKLGQVVHKLHSANLSHGDLHEGNVIVNNGELYLIDFGLAGVATPKSVESDKSWACYVFGIRDAFFEGYGSLELPQQNVCELPDIFSLIPEGVLKLPHLLEIGIEKVDDTISAILPMLRSGFTIQQAAEAAVEVCEDPRYIALALYVARGGQYTDRLDLRRWFENQ